MLSVSSTDTTPVVGGTATLSTTGGSGTGAVSYASDSANCTVNATTLTAVAVGNCTITATKAADANYTAATSAVGIVVGRASQAALSVSSTNTTPSVGDSAALSTSGGSGTGAVSFASDSANCTVSGTALTAAAVGNCTITATKAADTTYTVATATVGIVVGKASQVALSVSSTNTTPSVGDSAALSTTGGSGTGAVSFASDSANCTVSGTTLSAAAVGNCTITATKAADANYTVATGAVSIVVGPASPPTGPLNDTGQTLCDNGSNTLSTCTTATTGDAATLPRQDGRFGRDVAGLTKAGGGVAGFDFTKVCFNGAVEGTTTGGNTCTGSLVANTSGTASGTASTDWACTKDNVTQLIWSLQSQYATGTAALASTYPDAGHNSVSRCGFSKGWRLPTRIELLSSVLYDGSSPSIDASYFPGTNRDFYWTSEVFLSTALWALDYTDGSTTGSSKENSSSVRLVHSGL